MVRFRQGRTSRVLKVTAFILMALSSSAYGEGRRPVRSLAEIRHARVVIQKWDSSCGAAALATLLSYDLGDPVGERTVATAMLRRTDPVRVRVRGGFSLLNLQHYAQARGYQADGYGGMTVAHLSQMLPAIIPVRFHGYDHFIVVRHIRKGKVEFADPAYGRRHLPLDRFERAWVQKIAFVVRRSGG